jgi:predicted nucleic acid-binding protein
VEDLPEWLHNSTLLLDSNFFIDAFRYKKEYGDFIQKLKSMGVAFVAPNFVKYEFIRSRTIDVVREKEKYFHQIVDTVLPYDVKIDELVIPTIEEYKQNMENLPLTDLVLGVYLKRYRGLRLLTRDHNDFPTTVFTREYIFNIEEFRDRIYAVYSYKPKTKVLDEEIPF